MLDMSAPSIVVAVYPEHRAAEEAMKKLAKAGIDMKTISIIGKNYQTEETPVGYFNAADRAKVFGKLGGFWGGLFGILFGSLFLFIPVFGHIVVLGPLAAVVVNALEGAVLGGGAAAVVGALTAIGIPKNSVVRYETDIKADKFVVMVHGGAEIMEKARLRLAQGADGEGAAYPAAAA
jgi:hypothetical protein